MNVYKALKILQEVIDYIDCPESEEDRQNLRDIIE